MIAYLDTSSLVRLYIDEAGSDAVQQLVSSASLVATSVIAYPEARATFARRRREGLLTRAELARITRQFDADWPAVLAIEVTDAVARSAGALSEKHRLRGGDAIHLASFEEVLSRAGEQEVEFPAADEALVRAARRLG